MSNDNIVIHVVDQIYESDWFSEETMTKREEINENEKYGADAKSSLMIHILQGKGTMMQKDKCKTASTKSWKQSEIFV